MLVNLRHEMEKQGIGTAELSELTGIKIRNIQRYVYEGAEPTLKNAVILADGLNVSIDYLVGRRENCKTGA